MVAKLLFPVCCCLALWPGATETSAFPPAPGHLLYGLVRDEYGTPFQEAEAQIVLQTTNGVQIVGSIVPGLVAGVNYQLEIPMDSGLKPDIYSPSALRAATPFILYVVVGGVTNLPIQTTGNLSLLGQPAKQTRLDLTLGVDANGDGIPDAWELAFLASLGLNLDLSALQPNADYAHDGRSLRQGYLLGNYPFDPGDSFKVRIVSFNAGSPILEFTTMTGRSYSLEGSSDLKQWTPLSFTMVADGANGPQYDFYSATDIRTIQVQALQPMAPANLQLEIPAISAPGFYRLAQGSGTPLAARPRLSFSHTKTNSIVISWSGAAADWVLQQSPKLVGATWTTVTAAPVPLTQGTSQPGARFFRLMLQ